MLILIYTSVSFADGLVCTQSYSNMLCENETYSALTVHQYKYRNDTGWVDVETDFYEVNRTFQSHFFKYGNEKGIYSAYFDNNTPLTVMKYGNYALVQTPYAVGWYDHVTENWDTVQLVQDVSPILVGNELTYEGAFYKTNITYTYEGNMLKEVVTISEEARDYIVDNYFPVPTPENKWFIVANKLDFYNINMYNETGSKITNPTTVIGKLRFKDNVTEALEFFFPVSTAWASNTGYEFELQWRIVQYSGDWYVLYGIPITWFYDAEFPVYIDPSLEIDGVTTELYGNVEYDTVNVINGGTLSVKAYNGSATSGWLNLTVNDWLYVDSSSFISASQKGYTGGTGGMNGDCTGTGQYLAGYGGNAGSGQSSAGNGGTGTAQVHFTCGGGGAGGSGYGGAGAVGGAGGSYVCTGGSGGSAGSTYGDSTTDAIGTVYMGSGGGGGGGGSECCHTASNVYGTQGGTGGSGGGALRIYAPYGYIEIHGDILADGGNGGNGGNGAEYGCSGGASGGGGGSGASGGQVVLKAVTLNLSSSSIDASAGSGGGAGSGAKDSPAGATGNAGGGGRIKLFYNTTVDTSGMSYDVTGANAGSYNLATFEAEEEPVSPSIQLLFDYSIVDFGNVTHNTSGNPAVNNYTITVNATQCNGMLTFNSSSPLVYSTFNISSDNLFFNYTLNNTYAFSTLLSLDTDRDVNMTYSYTPDGFSVDGNTVALYHFEEGTGTAIADETGTHNMTASSSSIWAGYGKFGSDALNFEDTYYAIGNTLLDTVTANGTIEFWFKPDVELNSTYADFRYFFYKSGAGGDCMSAYDTTQDALRWHCNMQGVGTVEIYGNKEVYLADTWYHVAYTWGSNGMQLIVDGVVDGTDATTSYPVTNAGDSFKYGTQGGGSFNGVMDEMRVSDIQRDGSGITTEEIVTETVEPYYYLDVPYLQRAGDYTGNHTITGWCA